MNAQKTVRIAPSSAAEAAVLMRSELEALREQAAKVPALQCEIRGLRRQIEEERRRAGVAALVGLLAFAWVAV